METIIAGDVLAGVGIIAGFVLKGFLILAGAKLVELQLLKL